MRRKLIRNKGLILCYIELNVVNKCSTEEYKTLLVDSL